MVGSCPEANWAVGSWVVDSCVVGSCVVGSCVVGSWADAVVAGTVSDRCLSRFPLDPAPASLPWTAERFLLPAGGRGRGEAVPLP